MPADEPARGVPDRRRRHRAGTALYLVPKSEHWLDWFHITMRLTVMGQMTKGLATERDPPSELADEDDNRPDPAAMDKQLESLKWHLWHGNVYRALQIVE